MDRYTLCFYEKDNTDASEIIEIDRCLTFRELADVICSQKSLDNKLPFFFSLDRKINGDKVYYSDKIPSCDNSFGNTELKRGRKILFRYNYKNMKKKIDFYIEVKSIVHDNIISFDEMKKDMADDYFEEDEEDEIEEFFDEENDTISLIYTNRKIKDIILARKLNVSYIKEVCRSLGLGISLNDTKEILVEYYCSCIFKRENAFEIFTLNMIMLMKKITDGKLSFSKEESGGFIEEFSYLETLGILELDFEGSGFRNVRYYVSYEIKELFSDVIMKSEMWRNFDVFLAASTIMNYIIQIYNVVEYDKLFTMLKRRLARENEAIERKERENTVITKKELSKLMKAFILWHDINEFDFFGSKLISMFNISETMDIMSVRKRLGLKYETGLLYIYPMVDYSFDYCGEITYFMMSLMKENINFCDNGFDNMMEIEKIIRLNRDIEKVYAEIEKIIRVYGLKLNKSMKASIFEVWYKYPNPYYMGRSRKMLGLEYDK